MTTNEQVQKMTAKEKVDMLYELAMDLSDDYNITIDKYVKNDSGQYRWLFNWVGGGFNDSWGETKDEAVKNATDITCKLVPNRETFRKATRATYDAQNRAGWMASM